MAVRAVEEKHWRGEGATALLCAGGAQGRQAVAGYRPGGESFQLRSQGWYAQQDNGEATRTQRCVQQVSVLAVSEFVAGPCQLRDVQQHPSGAYGDARSCQDSHLISADAHTQSAQTYGRLRSLRLGWGRLRNF